MNKNTKTLETNGPANILMLLELYQSEIPEGVRQKLEKEARKTIEYMKQVEIKETKFWHEIETTKEGE